MARDGFLRGPLDELALCVVKSRRGSGTGFAFQRPRWIVTAKHVVAGQPPAEPLRLVFRQGVSLPAQVLFAHPRVDLAVLEVLGDSPCLAPFLPVGRAAVEGDLFCVGLKAPVSGEEAGYAPFVVRVESYERSVRQRDGYEEVLFIFPAPDGEQLRSGGPLLAPRGGVIGVIVDYITLEGQRMVRATGIVALLDHLGGNGGRAAKRPGIGVQRIRMSTRWSLDRTVDRKRLIREYKERPRPMGVFRVHNTAEQKSFVGSSVDAPAALNRERFQLKAGLHPNTALQADWKRLGAEAFEFEVLDSLDPSDRSDADRAADLVVLEHLWLEKLSPYEARGYNARPKGD